MWGKSLNESILTASIQRLTLHIFVCIVEYVSRLDDLLISLLRQACERECLLKAFLTVTPSYNTFNSVKGIEWNIFHVIIFRNDFSHMVSIYKYISDGSRKVIRNILNHEGKVIQGKTKFHAKCDFLSCETIQFRIHNYLMNSVKKPVMIWPHLPLIQYRHLIPAPVDRTSASALLYKQP